MTEEEYFQVKIDIDRSFQPLGGAEMSHPESVKPGASKSLYYNLDIFPRSMYSRFEVRSQVSFYVFIDTANLVDLYYDTL